MSYGCHNRPPLVEQYPTTHGEVIKNFSAGKPCEYRHTELGKDDLGCSNCKHKEKSMKEKGFSLIELLIVLAILSIIAAVAIPAFTGHRPHRFIESSCQ